MKKFQENGQLTFTTPKGTVFLHKHKGEEKKEWKTHSHTQYEP